jgi:hypothetical protein
MTETRWLSRVRRPVVIWALAALLAELAVEGMRGRMPSMSPTMQTALALAPLIPSLLFMLSLVRIVMQMDELQKRITLESVFIAFVSSLTLIFVFSGLEQAGAYHPPWSEVGTTMMALWAVAYVYSSWKYR